MNPRGSGARRIACSLLILSLLLVPAPVVRSQSGPFSGPSDGAQSETPPGAPQYQTQETPQGPQNQPSAEPPAGQSPYAAPSDSQPASPLQGVPGPTSPPQTDQAPQAAPGAPAPSPDSGMPPVAAPAPTGLCTLKVSTDRSTMHLMDPVSGAERKHVSLGRDRMQRAFTSPDGAWTVVLYKVRGVPQYGIVAIDLANCEPQDFVNVPAAAEAARFSADDVTLTFPGGKEQKIGLRNKALP